MNEKVTEIEKILEETRQKSNNNYSFLNIQQLLEKLGVKKEIIENFDTLGLGIDFYQLIQCFLRSYPDIEVSEQGRIVMSCDYGSTYLTSENRMVSPIRIKLIIDNGEVNLITSYDKKTSEFGKKSKKADNYEICTGKHGDETSAKSRHSEYVLTETIGDAGARKYHGDAFVTLIETTKTKGQLCRSDISMSNDPDIYGLKEEYLQEQLRLLMYHDAGLKPLREQNLFCPIIDWHSIYVKSHVNSERNIYRGKDLTNVKFYRHKNMPESKTSYSTPISGEYDMKFLLNNCSSFNTVEEATEENKIYMENGFFDVKEAYYREQNTERGNYYADQIAALKETLLSKKNL